MDDASLERWEQLERSLTNISPSMAQIERIEDLREHGKQFGYQILSTVRGGRERSLALTHLEDAMMWAVKGIVLEERE